MLFEHDDLTYDYLSGNPTGGGHGVPCPYQITLFEG